jgi:hypothetical protein
MKELTEILVKNKHVMVWLMAVSVMLFAPNLSWALNTPATDSFAYDVYKIAVTNILQGPVGFVGGVTAIVFGAIMAIRAQVLPAVAAIIGGGVLLGADKIVQSMGSVIF